MRRVLFRVLSVVFSVLFFCLVGIGTSSAATYTVQSGDTFYLIARQYGLTAAQLMAANGYATGSMAPGQVLIIPLARHTVAPGDSLYQIASRNDTTVEDLIALNNLSPDSRGSVNIYPGQVLLLSGSGGAGVAEAGVLSAWSGQYTVRPGDTLDQIARQYGTTVYAIRSANNLGDTVIYPGQVLSLPAGSYNAQASRAGLSASDTYLLAQLINAEAGGESFEGQVSVGAVVLNRLFDPRFPKTIGTIVFQYDDGTYQFEPVLNGAIYESPCPSAIRAAYAALTGWDPTGGALYFYNPKKATSTFFESCLTYLRQIGNHLFYR